jgi:hypothetical protein
VAEAHTLDKVVFPTHGRIINLKLEAAQKLTILPLESNRQRASAPMPVAYADRNNEK